MRALAEFVMRGRMEATGVCVACAMLPFTHWLGSAIVALVILRQGMAEGGMLLLWTSLPLAGWFILNQDVSPLLVLAGTGTLAFVLRATVSWEATLASTVVVSVIAGLLFQVVSADLLARLADWYIELFKAMEQDMGVDAASTVMSFFAIGQAYAMVAALLLARWWQSTLYNPGGFQQEFHGLKLSPRLSIAIAGLMLLLYLPRLPMLAQWIPLLTVPLILAAIALVHWLVSRWQLTTGWLVTFYLMLFFMSGLIFPILASVALMDSWLDLRKRIRSNDPQ